MAFNFELDLDRFTVNKYIKYVGQSSFSSKVTTRKHRHTHPTACFLLYPVDR